MRQQVFDTRFLSRFVSDLAGQEVEVFWEEDRNMAGYLGQANWRMIKLNELLARKTDPILPKVFFHELGHVVLHKRSQDPTLHMSDEESEQEATLFANAMLLRLGGDFVWDALQGGLSDAVIQRAKTEIMKFADSKNFRRNQVKPAAIQQSGQPQTRRRYYTYEEAMRLPPGAPGAVVHYPRSATTGSVTQGRQSSPERNRSRTMEYATIYR